MNKESMSRINKLIFVQDFQEAALELKKLTELEMDNCEAHFRRVELATRMGTLKELNEEYRNLDLAHQSKLAIQLTRLLIEIRIHETSEYQIQKDPDILGFHPDIQFLQSRVTMETQLKPSRGTTEVKRQPMYADDLMIEKLKTVQLEAKYDDGRSFHEPQQLPAMGEHLKRATALAELHPKNYAALYVAGCAYEQEGNLGNAIEFWQKAYRLHPTSIAILSTLSELQHMGALPTTEVDYSKEFESQDAFLVHGSYETHTGLYREFLASGEYRKAIAALRTLADWIQRQRGEVPREIEALCLLGAMKAYQLDDNEAASEACRNEVEHLVYKTGENPDSPLQLCFVAQICEEFGLHKLASQAFCKLIANEHTPLELTVKTAAHCISTRYTDELRHSIWKAYLRTRGNAEVRFCLLLCSLVSSDVNIDTYLKRKSQLRNHLEGGNAGHALSLLEECMNDTTEDPETHCYYAELLSKMGATEKALEHFAKMYELDPLNLETTSRYLFFLLHEKSFERVLDISSFAVSMVHMNDKERGEMLWIKATATFGLGHTEEAFQLLQQAIQIAPWNLVFLITYLKFSQLRLEDEIPEIETIIRRLESGVFTSTRPENQEQVQLAMQDVTRFLNMGYQDIAYTTAKILFSTFSGNENVNRLFVRTSAACNTHACAKDLILLAQTPNASATHPFQDIAFIIAQVYAGSGEWRLMDEWLQIAKSNTSLDLEKQSLVHDLDALKLAMQGTQLDRALHLIEASIDAAYVHNKKIVEREILHAYLLIQKGDLRSGTQKLKLHLNHTDSIQFMYFIVKGLARADMLAGPDIEQINRLFHTKPQNSYEQKLIEEIYFLLGKRVDHTLVYLAS